MTFSLGYRTDLALLAAQGARFEHHAGHTVVRTAANPHFHWGNFLLLHAPPAAHELPVWVATFRRAFPEADYLALGVDGAGTPAPSHELGLQLESSAVLTAESLQPPAYRETGATIRPMQGEADWAASFAHARETDGTGEDTFVRDQQAAMRGMQDRGHGMWFGAFLQERMVASLGIFHAGHGLARFQDVTTNPGYRRRGLAASLVHAAGRYAFDRMGAHTLVIVAAPDGPAARIYRRLGFRDTDTQVKLAYEPA